MTTLTLTTIAIMVYGVLGRGGYGRALALGGATGAGAALVVGGTAVPTFYATALGTLIALGLQAVGNGRAASRPRLPLPPEVSSLLAFFAWSFLVTVVAPILFDGMPVLAPNGLPRHLNAGALISSNYAQTVYLALGISVVVFLARSPYARPELIGLAAGLTTILSLWRYFHTSFGFPFPEGFFDNSPAFNYVETAPKGIERFRGILSEPAGLAVSSLVAIAYMLPRSMRVQGWRRLGCLAIAAAAAYMGAISTSATFVVAGGLTLALAGIAVGVGFVIRRTAISAAGSVLICVAVILAIWVLPAVSAFVEETVNDKLGSSSYSIRSGSNIESYNILLDTFGLGVGLGASRSSSFLPGLLSTTGLIGTLLFTVAVASLIYRSAAVREYRPVIWALVTLLVVKVVSGPDLSDSTGILYLSLGLLSHAIYVRRNEGALASMGGSLGTVRSAGRPVATQHDRA